MDPASTTPTPTPPPAKDSSDNKAPNQNGTTTPFLLKKHHQQLRHPPPPPAYIYRECLKNHAASLGATALDGCGEFMPSPTSNPADPSSLTCAACGCHRNFHRRFIPGHHLHLLEPRPLNEQHDIEEEDDDDQESGSQNDEEVDRRHSTSPPPPSAPHMLLALSTGLNSAGPTAAVGPTLPRKRFRSKFSPEQKGRMLELSERLGWRMQKRDEGVIEECCREIGVGKGVFKVWMHNNKHNLRNNAANSPGVDAGTATSNVNATTNHNGSNGNGSGGDSHMQSGSSS